MAATDTFAAYQSGLDSPAIHAVVVTADNTNQFTNAARGIYVGVGGNVELLTLGGETVLFIGVQSGSIIPIRAVRVNVSNTTATNMVALY